MNVDYILNGQKKKGEMLSPNYILNGTVKRPTKKTKYTNVTNKQFWATNGGNLNKAWSDFDKDGVVNGLDCYPYDVNRHGFFAKAFNKLRGRGFIENDEYKGRQRFTEANKNFMREDDRLNRASERMGDNINNARARRYVDDWVKAKQEKEAAAEALMEVEKRRSAEEKETFKDKFNRAKEKYESGWQKADEKLKSDYKTAKENIERKKAMKGPGLVSNVISNVGEDIGTWGSNVKRGVQRSVGYVTVSPEERMEMKQEDFDNYRASLIAAGVDPKKVKGVSEKVAGTEEFYMKRKDLLDKVEEKEKDRYYNELNKVRADLSSKYGKNQSNEKQAEYARREKELKDRMNNNISRGKLDTLEMLDKTSITAGGAKNLFKDEMQEIRLAKAAKVVQEKQTIAESRYADLRRMTSEANLSDLRGRMNPQRPMTFGGIGGGGRQIGSDIFSEMRSSYNSDIFSETRAQFNQNNTGGLFNEPRNTFNQNMAGNLFGEVKQTIEVVPEAPKPLIMPISGLLGTQEHIMKAYDAEKPRFIYQKKFGNLTRKTDRVRKGDNLQIGQASIPSMEKRPGSMYPWTKPMMGWERVYVGKGNYTGAGRKPQNAGTYNEIRPKYSSKTMKYHPPKRKFVPYVRTYGTKFTSYL